MNIKKTVITGIIIFLSFSCSQRDSDYYYVKGSKYYFQEKNYELAIECFTKAVDIDNKNASAYFARAMIYDKLGKTELAIADYTSAIKYDYKKAIASAYTNRGANYLTLNEYDKAISDFKTAIENDSLFLKPYFKLAEIYQERNDLDLSNKYLSKIISIDPLNARAYSDRGINFSNQKRYREAIEDFNIAIKLGTENDYLYLMRGGNYTFLGNTELALQDFNKGIEINPKNSQLYFVRAVLHQKFSNNEEQAIADFKKSTDLGSNEAKTILKDYYKIDY